MFYVFILFRGPLATQVVKNPPAMWEIWVQSLGWEDLLQTGMATHFSILAWRIPWTRLSSWIHLHLNPWA